MTTKPIVVGTDGSAQALRTVEWAAREAVLRSAPLRIVSAAEMLPRMNVPAKGQGIGTVAGHLSGDRDLALADCRPRSRRSRPWSADRHRSAGRAARPGGHPQRLGRAAARRRIARQRRVPRHGTRVREPLRRRACLMPGRGGPGRRHSHGPSDCRRHTEHAGLRRRARVRLRGGPPAEGGPAGRPRVAVQGFARCRAGSAGWTTCWTTGSASIPTSTRVAMSYSVTRDGYWPTCRRRPT